MNRLLFACGLLLLLAGPLWLLGQKGHSTSSFTVSESETTYKLLLTCDVAPHARIIQYLNDRLQPTPALLATQRLPTHLRLRDQTDLVVRTAPGELRLTINKETNSAAAVEQIRQLAPELKRLTLAATQ